MATRRARRTEGNDRLQSAHYRRITQALARNRDGVGTPADIRKAMRRSFWYYYMQQLIANKLLRKSGRGQYQLTTAGRQFAKAR
jgi:hypothetical protein